MTSIKERKRLLLVEQPQLVRDIFFISIRLLPKKLTSINVGKYVLLQLQLTL